MSDINSNLPTADSADGSTGSAAPSTAIEVAGKDGSGNLQPLKLDGSGNLQTINTSAGTVVPGTVATNSTLVGGQYNSSLPTLTTGQQAALQVDSSGRAIVSGTVFAKLEDGVGNAINSSVYGSVRSLDVHIGDGNQRDGFGRIRVADTDLIEALHFSNTGHPLLVNTSTTGSSTAAYNSAASSLRLSNTTSSSDSAIAQTKRYFRYNPGRSYIVTLSGNIGAKKTNVRQRWGYFDANNGIFFQQDSSNLSVVVRTDTSGSPVDTVINQSSWNIDKLDGTGPSGVTLDTSKHNLFVTDFLWHGAGRIRWGLLVSGSIVYCNEFIGANTATTPFMRTPSLPLRMELTNTGTAATSTTLDLVCFAYQKESSDTLSAPYKFSASTIATATNLSSTIIPLIAIRPKTTFNGNTNRVPVIPASVQVAAQQNLIYVGVYLNPVLTGASFASVDANSAVEFDTAATAMSGGTKIDEFYVAASSTLSATVSADIVASLDLVTLGLNIAGNTQDVLVIAARSTAGGTNAWTQIEWQEFQ